REIRVHQQHGGAYTRSLQGLVDDCFLFNDVATVERFIICAVAFDQAGVPVRRDRGADQQGVEVGRYVARAQQELGDSLIAIDQPGLAGLIAEHPVQVQLEVEQRDQSCQRDGGAKSCDQPGRCLHGQKAKYTKRLATAEFMYSADSSSSTQVSAQFSSVGRNLSVSWAEVRGTKARIVP